MDPITIAASIAAVKGVLKTAKDVKQISTALGDLFHNQEQHAKKSPNKKKPKTRMQQVLRIRAGETTEAYDDDTSISSVTTDIIEEKQNYLALQGLAKEVDVKWGKGTWAAIKEEQAKRIKDHKEAAKKAKKAAKEKAEEDKIFYKKVATEVGKALIIILVIAFISWFLYYAATLPK